MKFLHLADLHIGKTVNGFSMLDSQIYIFEQIIEYVRQHKPNAVIIAGDIYDKPVPNTEAVRVFDRLLTDIVQQKVAALIINGNHDSPERIGFASEIMHNQNVHLYGVFDGQMKTICLDDQYGSVYFHLLPFIRPSTIKPFYDSEETVNCHDAVKAVIESAQIDKSKRNVLIAHQFVVWPGGSPERSESEIGPVGGLDSINTDIMTGFDYIALGHLHGAQKVGCEHIRYAGSPLKYSFSECYHKKSVALVELLQKGQIDINLLALTPLYDMRCIKGTLAELTEKSIVAQGNAEDFIHVTLTDQNEIIDAMGKIRNVYPNVMGLAFDNARTRAVPDFDIDYSIKDNITPSQQFGLFFNTQNGMDMSSEQAAIVNNLLDKIGGEL